MYITSHSIRIVLLSRYINIYYTMAPMSVLEWLALYRAVLPKATLAECRAFLFNMDPNEPPYSNSQFHRAEQLLDLKREAASTTADFATLPSNMLKHELYWTMPPPLGMVGVAVADIIDIDKAGFFLESSNRNFGKTVSCLRCSQMVCTGVVRK